MKRFNVRPPSARRSKKIVLGPPNSDSRLFLGQLAEVGPSKEVDLDLSQEHVVAVVGKRGSGKTHTLGVLVEGLCISDSSGRIGINNTSHGVLVFDTLNLFQWIGVPLESAGGSTAARQITDAASWSLPLSTVTAQFWHLAGSTPLVTQSQAFNVGVGEMTPQDWGILLDVDTVGDPMGQLITAGHEKTIRTGWISKNGRTRALERPSIADLIRCIFEDREIASQFAPETIRAVGQRLSGYERTGLFSTVGTKLTDILKPGQASVFLLARATEDLRTLIVFLLIRKLLEERSSESERVKDAIILGRHHDDGGVPRSWVVIDEAQNIIPSRTASIANRELTRFVREGRNFGLSMAISTQQPDAIDPRVMAQVDTLIAHTLTVNRDVSYIQSNFKSALPVSIKFGRQDLSISDALRELDVGQALVSALDAPRTMFVQMRPRITPHGGFEA